MESTEAERRVNLFRNCAAVAATLGCLLACVVAFAQSPAPAPKLTSITGVVVDAAGNPVDDADVRLESDDSFSVAETKSGVDGRFELALLHAGKYKLSAKKSGQHTRAIPVTLPLAPDAVLPKLVLEAGDTEIEFSDKPNFTVAGVTDFTAVGGHGSDTILRTSEDLTRETYRLGANDAKGVAASGAGNAQRERELRAALAAAPGSFAANHQLGEFYLNGGRPADAATFLEGAYHIDPQDRDNEIELANAQLQAGDAARAREHVNRLLAQNEGAQLDRMMGEIDERLADPLAAVREFERAVKLDPNEQNYVEWGSELLLHRAIWQARDVFQAGVHAYPKSERMLMALGSALFAGALYDDAASAFCRAVDLNPIDAEPYMALGKVQAAAPEPLDCAETKLADFVAAHPDNSLANYFYAMAILKRQQKTPDAHTVESARGYFQKAVSLDAKCAEGYLQLGNLAAVDRDTTSAIGFYRKAIDADPELGDAHYRLGVAYDRIGESAKAKSEFALHDEIEKRQAAAVEHERREIKQFVVTPADANSAPQH